MKETSKARLRRQANWAFVNRFLVGSGIDIGAGDDPLQAGDYPNCTGMTVVNRPDGSSAALEYADEQFNFVYASNVLEHMPDMDKALQEWLRVCRAGGHVIVVVPDWSLYEYRQWPSRWNAGHRHRFTVDSLYAALSRMGGEIIKIELVDTRYDYAIKQIDQTWPTDGAEAFIEAVVRK